MKVAGHITNHLSVATKGRSPFIVLVGSHHRPTQRIACADKNIVRGRPRAFEFKSVFATPEAPVNADSRVPDRSINQIPQEFVCGRRSA